MSKSLTNIQTPRNDLPITHFLLKKTVIIFSFYWITLKILVGLRNFHLSNSFLFRLRFGPCPKITVAASYCFISSCTSHCRWGHRWQIRARGLHGPRVMGVRRNFCRGGKVDILFIFFSLLAMQRKWTYTKRKCPMLRQQLHTVFSL